MDELIKIDLEKLKSLIEIPLDKDPNYTFDIFLGGKSYQIQIRTFVNGSTRLSIFSENETIVNLAPINIYQVNLAFFSKDTNIVFFFLRNPEMTGEPTFLNFGDNDLRLFYGNI